MTQQDLQALVPDGTGHHFVFYGDSCSGVPGALHAEKLAKVNAVVRRFSPAPEFIVFPGDEVIGLIPDEQELREQWAYFFNVEMAWLRETQIPMFHSTGNHTTYDRMSERVFADVLSHLPRNGPADQQGLSYFVRKDDLLLVFVHTLWSGFGGEGHLELEWLDRTLEAHADAKWTFVVGHHPAFAVNGYAGPYQRTIGAEYVDAFWDILRQHGVLAYLCSHILAFDVQCHQGILQITSAGAGTAHRMPEDVEYLHCVQMCVDDKGLRYQVLDEDAVVRELLVWPPKQPKLSQTVSRGEHRCDWAGAKGGDLHTILRFTGEVSGEGARQTLLAAVGEGDVCPLWIGLVGRQRQLTVVLQPQRGRSPHLWLGPSLKKGESFDLELLLNGDMGPGGFLWRPAGTDTWTGLIGMSPWGTERLIWPERLSVGQVGVRDDTRFEGKLSVSLGSHATGR